MITTTGQHQLPAATYTPPPVAPAAQAHHYANAPTHTTTQVYGQAPTDAHPHEQDPNYDMAVRIVHDLASCGDPAGMEMLAGRSWVSREPDAALVAAIQGALDGQIVFIRAGGFRV